MRNHQEAVSDKRKVQIAFKKYPLIVMIVNRMKKEGFELTSREIGSDEPKRLAFEKEYDGIMQERRTIEIYASGEAREHNRDIRFINGKLSQLLKATERTHSNLLRLHNIEVRADSDSDMGSGLTYMTYLTNS